MADLFVNVQRQRSDPFPIPGPIDALATLLASEALSAADHPFFPEMIGDGTPADLTVSRTDPLHVTEAVIAALQLVRAVTNELAHVTDLPVSTAWPSGLSAGQMSFVASPNHADVINYEARIYTYPAGTLAAFQTLGVPTPDGTNTITVNLTATLSGLAAGGYTVSVAAVTMGGETESAQSSPFSLPLT